MADEKEPKAGFFTRRFAGGQKPALPPGAQRPALPPGESTEPGALARSGDELLAQLRAKYGRDRQQQGPPEQTTTRYRFSRKATKIEYKEVLVYFLVDATSSMQPLIVTTATAVVKIIGHAYSHAPEGSKLNARVVFFRDYCDGAGIVEMSPISSNPEELAAFTTRVVARGGGDIPEAVEYVLEQVLQETPQPNLLFLLGDAPGHPRQDIPATFQGSPIKKRTAREVSAEYGERHTPVHTIAVIRDAELAEDFQAIASASGGAYGFMSQDDNESMTTMVTAGILNAVADSATVVEFLEHRGLPSAGVQQYVKGLIG